MKYDREKALEIAQRNAVLAISEGYTATQDTTNPVKWTVTRPDGETYTLHLHFNAADRSEYLGFCECKFSGNGFENHTCKHIEICREVADAAYYGEVDRQIAATVRRIREEEEAEHFIITATGKKYPRPVATSLRVSLDENSEPAQPSRFTYRSIGQTSIFGDPSMSKAFAADADL